MAWPRETSPDPRVRDLNDLLDPHVDTHPHINTDPHTDTDTDA